MDILSKTTVEAAKVESHIGARHHGSDVADRTEVPDVATGLTWAPSGGEILFIEASLSQESGRLTITSQLGDVLTESVQAAVSYLETHTNLLGRPRTAVRFWDLHVHVPAGGIPKDGPSGPPALYDCVGPHAAPGAPHHGHDGRDHAVRPRPTGGWHEGKVLATRRAGIEHALLRKKNEKDVADNQNEALDGLTIMYLERMVNVLDLVLEEEQLADPADYLAVPDEEKLPSGSVVGDESEPQQIPEGERRAQSSFDEDGRSSAP